ncbi:hypothetical protein [Psychromicrobium xiongbiense]|uniref:hypothetical protein n=1 Tax=Psychromicrobium xiongbiense TaxID=3051184 RepID=UPI0025551119|nr:hypothetical protein [Psychromicrobium sp. YIM S02556]
MKISSTKARLIIGAVGLAVLLSAGGFAAANASGRSDAVAGQQQVKPHFAQNQSGKTYGSAASASAPNEEPDLIQVKASNGRVGYVYKTELDAASGDPQQLHFKSPAEALAWQAKHAGKTEHLAVYEADGTTKIGEFVINPSQGQLAGKP